MERHVRLLDIFATLWGGLALLVGVSMLLLAAGALAELADPLGDVGLAASLTGAVFGLIGVVALLWGGAHVWGAAMLRRRQPLGRVFMLALALANLLVLPFGTALGIYALWVLLTNDGRRLFEPGHAAAAGPAR